MQLRQQQVNELNLGEWMTKALTKWMPDDIYPSCLTCRHFKNELCKLNGLRPPAIVIVRGCEVYDDCFALPF